MANKDVSEVLPPPLQEVFPPTILERLGNCDLLLEERCWDSARIANDFLHFKGIRQIDMSIHKLSTSRAIWKGIKRSVVDQIRLVRDVAIGPDAVLPDVPPVEILIVSHYFNSTSQATKNARDGYFGSLSKSLIAAGLSTATVTVNQTAVSFPHSEQSRAVLPRRGARLRELRFAFQLFRDACRLAMTAFRHHARPEFRSVALVASLSSLSSASRMNLRLAHQISTLALTAGASNVVISFEGNAWERTCALAIRDLRLDCRVTGYQHAPATPGLHALFRPITRMTDPNLILCSSLAGVELITQGWGKTPTQVALVGMLSTEIAASSIINLPKSANKHVLLAPDGTPSETHYFMELADHLARRFPSSDFTLRLHPVARNWKVVREYQSRPGRLGNLHFSSSPLREDVATMDVLLYRSSGVSLVACLMSRAALVFVGRDPNLDPLWNLGARQDNFLDAGSEMSDILQRVEPTRVHFNPNIDRGITLGLNPNLPFAVDYLKAVCTQSPRSGNLGNQADTN